MLNEFVRRYIPTPRKMRECRNWLICGEDKIPRDKNGRKTSVHNSDALMSYEDALKAVLIHSMMRTGGLQSWHIGFVLTPDCGMVCVDIDVVTPAKATERRPVTTEAQYRAYERIVGAAATYVERSVSGYGWHIWLEGEIDRAYKRDGLELYSDQRFIVCTGDALPGKPLDVLRQDDFLTQLVSELTPLNDRVEAGITDADETKSDTEIWNECVNATNADKFLALFHGDFSGYPSQSEADLALMSIIAFYSENNAQCMRIFRYSQLGKRAKAVKDDRYLMRTLSIIRSRMKREADQAKALEVLLQASIERDAEDQKSIERDKRAAYAEVAAIPDEVYKQDYFEDRLEWPDGLMGETAKYIYESSPRPVKEIAIASALAFWAGITGKAWHIPGSGLNMYIALIARSGVGKEAMHSGIANLMRSTMLKCPSIGKYIDFSDYASGQALVKVAADRPSFLNVVGEWGRKLKQCVRDEGPGATLRTALTNFYAKSGPNSVAGGIAYSNKETNVIITNGVAYSMIGESTPDTYFDTLTNSMVEDGFLSRFLTIEYKGDRPDWHDVTNSQPDDYLTDRIAEICNQAEKMNMAKSSVPIKSTDDAQKMMKAYSDECDRNIRGELDEMIRQVWNRAALKAFRIAGILAVLDNHIQPVIDVKHFRWAKSVVDMDTSDMLKRVASGDIGDSDDSTRTDVAIETCYKILFDMPECERKHAKIIEYRELYIRLYRRKVFTLHRLGANRAIRDTIDTLLQTGDLVPIPKTITIEKYGKTTQHYRILTNPAAKLRAAKNAREHGDSHESSAQES